MPVACHTALATAPAVPVKPTSPTPWSMYSEMGIKHNRLVSRKRRGLTILFAAKAVTGGG